jgi:hypothetical protein
VEGRLSETPRASKADEEMGRDLGGKGTAEDQKGKGKASEPGWFSHPWRKIKRLMGD